MENVLTLTTILIFAMNLAVNPLSQHNPLQVLQMLKTVELSLGLSLLILNKSKHQASNVLATLPSIPVSNLLSVSNAPFTLIGIEKCALAAQ